MHIYIYIWSICNLCLLQYHLSERALSFRPVWESEEVWSYTSHGTRWEREEVYNRCYNPTFRYRNLHNLYSVSRRTYDMWIRHHLLCFSAWLETGKLQRVVLVIIDQATSETLERWNFVIEADQEVLEKGYVCFSQISHTTLISF